MRWYAVLACVLAWLRPCQAADHSFTVREGMPTGTLIGTINTRVGLQYAFSYPPMEFHLHPVTGEITTAIVIDRELLANDFFDLFVQSTPSGQHLMEVRITVLDVNDNSPIFQRAEITVSFSESDKAGTQVILDTATDKDIGVNDVTNDYQFVSGNELQRFRLVLLTDTSTPLLYLENTESLDREETSRYKLNISTHDGGSPARYGYLVVNIEIRDINDNPPLFDQSDYSVSINETIALFSSIIRVHATDTDSDANADITYSVVNDDFSQFTIGPKSGVVSTLKRLQCDRQCAASEKTCHHNSCVVTLEARDHGHPFPLSGRAYLTVNLVDENDHAPVIKFQYYPSGSPHAMVDEGAQVDTIVAVVSITDADSGINGETSAKIVSGNEAGHFVLSLSHGFNTIRVAGRLDREHLATYNLTVEARDHGRPSRSSIAVLHVTVNDINDHSPVFVSSSHQVTLNELVPVGSFVATMRAVDGDSGDNALLTYSILAGNQLGWFHIESSSGLVTTQKPLDYETQRFLQLKVEVKDGASRPLRAYANLSVNIVDENDETPKFAASVYNVTVVEDDVNLPKSVVTVTATDGDSGKNGTVHYSFGNRVEQWYHGMFKIDRSSGEVTALRPIDREQYPRFTLTVWAEDLAVISKSSSVLVNIHVADVNDNFPVFYPVRYYARVQQGQMNKTRVVCVTASDLDVAENGTVRYAFTDAISEQTASMFSMESDGCVWTTGRTFRLTIQSLYVIHVTASDLSGRHARLPAVIEVTVQGDSPPPMFINEENYRFVITEDVMDTNVGRFVGVVSATGTDGRLTYTIVSGDPDSVFRIDSQSGRIVTAKSVDREAQASYSIRVIASGGSSYAETVVNVTVLDANDNAPQFDTDNIHVTIEETTPIGGAFLRLHAHDADDDDNAIVTYSFPVLSDNFEIDKNSGVIKLMKSLRASGDRQFQIIAVATDSGRQPMSTSVRITITVTDDNIHTPHFQNDYYTISVNESIVVGERFYQMSATDEDLGTNGDLSYSLIFGNDALQFGIFPDGYIYVAKSLDREKTDLYVLRVRAEDGGDPSRSSVANVIVHVMDANDNSPRFTNDTYKFIIDENQPALSYVGRVIARDADSGANGDVHYAIQTTSENFRIDPSSGIIMSLRAFDRESLGNKRNYFNLVVTATDSGRIRQRGSCLVVISVADLNDNSPVFAQSFYRSSVTEAAAMGALVLTVSATDADLEAVIVYSILDGNADEKFNLDSKTGQIRVAGELDREETSNYSITILAVDADEPDFNTTTNVFITILDDNDNAPKFDKSIMTIDVKEDVDVDELVLKLSATDRDLGENATVSYRLQNDVFKIDENSGDIYLSEALDYELKKDYVLHVVAVDAGNPQKSATCTININVLDVNDNEPRFYSAPIIKQIVEGASVGTSVAVVSATDADFGDNGRLVYSIVKRHPESHVFTISATSGLITTSAELDREVVDQYRVWVEVTDQSTEESRKSAQKLVTVAVGDRNDNSPVFLSASSIAVDSDVSVGSRVATVRATDADIGNNAVISYSVVAGESDMFHVNETTGALYLRKPMSQRLHEITVSARDHGGAGGDDMRTTFHRISLFPVAPNSDKLRFALTRYRSTVKENEPTATSVLTVGVKAADKRHVTYHLTEVTSGGVRQPRYFQVHSSSGLISTTQPLDYERGYVLFLLRLFAVESTEDRLYTHSTLVEIELTDTNDNPPVFIPPAYDLQVSPESHPRDVLTVVIATDLDQNSKLQYSVKEGGNDIFSIDPVKGELSLLSLLPADRNRYNLIISASDGLHETTADVTITVATTSTLKFEQDVYSFEISEMAAKGIRIGRLAVSKKEDIEGEVFYRWGTRWASDVFRVDSQTGVIRLTGALDFEQVSLYVLTAEVQDASSHTTNVSVFLNVVDCNDNAPMFDTSAYSNQLYENVTVGTQFITVIATDIDSGQNGVVHYYITEGNEGGHFMVGEKTGAIKVVKPLDREEQPFYKLTVKALDQPSDRRKQLSAFTTVTVMVKDINDSPPRFDVTGPVTVSEDSPIGTSVFTASTSDDDQGDNALVSYSLLRGADAFRIDATTGVVYTTQLLDRERVDSYTIQLVAVDTGRPPLSSTAQFDILVSDENDHTPIIGRRLYNIEIAEDVKVGVELLAIDALDADIGVNAQLRYVIVSGDSDADFYLDSHSGRLSVNLHLDYERVQEYSLKVKVHDLGEPQRSAMADVYIKVTDINDCAPVFANAPYVGYVVENGPAPVVVLRVSAMDRDSRTNSAVTYAMQEGELSTFHVNKTTGDIKLLQKLDREQQDEYELVVLATDSGYPALTSTTKVKIVVSDVNDHCPVFTQHIYVGSVPENSPSPSHVVKVAATDKDIGENSQIRYTLRNDFGGIFVIDADTGDITSRQPLDREHISSYNLVVIATDAGIVPCESEAAVTVQVDDVNDNRPRFSQTSYSAVLRDPTEKGWFVLGVRAEDEDISQNAYLTYSLSANNSRDLTLFKVDAKTGIITTNSRLVARQQGYQLYVRVSDKGNPPLDDVVSLAISFLPTDTRGFPEFTTSQRSFQVPEGTTSRLIHTFKAVVAGGGSTITYRIAGGNIDGAFTVMPSSGQLFGRVDYERRPHYYLVLEAMDVATRLTGYVGLNIDVIDANDNPPIFSKPYYNVGISERVVLPQSIIKLTASDADSQDNGRVTYKLMNTYNIFTIDSQQGALSLLVNLDREAVSLYTLQVLAIDQGSPRLTGSATVIVTVLDENDNPPVFTQYFTASVREDATNGTHVIHVTSSDADVGVNAKHTYALSEQSAFCIDSKTGEVTVCGELNHELQDVYVIGVSTHDGVYRQETSLTIHLIDINDNPPRFIEHHYRFHVKSTDTHIGTVHATDADADGDNSDVYYKLSQPSSEIRVNPQTGQLSFVGIPPDGTTVLTVMAVDRGLPPLTGRAIVTVVRSQTGWIWFDRNEYSVLVENSASLGDVLIRLRTHSHEEELLVEDVVYSITGGNGSQLFNLHSSTGVLTPSQSLAASLHRSYLLNISATADGATSSCIVTVRVVRENLHSPEFYGDSFSVTIPEDKPIDSDIAVLYATDADANDKVAYSIVAGGNRLFEVDAKGHLKVIGQLDYESQQEHRLVVMATDNGAIPRNTSVAFTVYVTDVNDNPPIFQQVSVDASVAEISPVQTSVVQLTATDADVLPNNVIRYQVRDAVPFAVDEVSGWLYNRQVLDYELQREYTMVVIASNPHTELSSEVTVHVQVTGVNEFTPRFTQRRYVFTASEASRPGVAIGAVTAIDLDDDDEIVYHLIGDSNLHGFTINHQGSVIVTRSVDRESTNEILLSAIATNMDLVTGADDYDECTVRIVISDANDSPRFSQAVYTARLREDSPIGSQVIRVSAIDSDLKVDDRRFSYGIRGVQFSIDTHSGWVTLNTGLDRETTSMYNVTLLAVDNGLPPQTGTAQLVVHVSDVNDNAPHFKPTIPRGRIPENQRSLTAVAIDLKTVTFDADQHQNRGPYRYQLLNATDTFQLGETSGLLLARRHLDREDIAEYTLSIEIRDNGQPVLSSVGTVVVEVGDENDNAAMPRPMDVHVYATEGSTVAGTIADVRPLDRDAVGAYTCSFLSDISTLFEMSHGCQLQLLSTPEQNRYDLSIVGSDGLHADVTYTARVHFHWFESAALDASVSVELSIEPSAFLQNSYKSFLAAIEAGLGQSAVLLGVSVITNGVGLVLAARNGSGGYMERHQFTNWLLSEQAVLASENGIEDIHVLRCTDAYCLHGGVCKPTRKVHNSLTSISSDKIVVTSAVITSTLSCHCIDGYTGDRCQTPRARCDSTSCLHSGVCCPLVGCACTTGWQGSSCEIDVNECESSPCQFGATCINTPGSYRCQCNPGVRCPATTTPPPRIPTCPSPPRSFASLSFAHYNISLDRRENRISLRFKTLQQYSLLLYYPAGVNRFVAVEIISGIVRFSFALGASVATRVNFAKPVADGYWHQLMIVRVGKHIKMKLTDCPADGITCHTCKDGNATCEKVMEGEQFEEHEVGRELLSVGGVKSIRTLLSRPMDVSTHDFVGCLRQLTIDGRSLWQEDALESSGVSDTCSAVNAQLQCLSVRCENGGSCVTTMAAVSCHCPEGFTGPLCEHEVKGGFSFAGSAYVSYTLNEAYRRSELLTRSSRARHRRAAQTSRLSMSIHTAQSDGVLFYSGSQTTHTALYIHSSQLHYVSVVGGKRNSLVSSLVNVSDSHWHEVSLTITGTSSVILSVDTAMTERLFDELHEPFSLEMTSFTVGGSKRPVLHEGEKIAYFSGCLRTLHLNGSPLPLGGSTDQFIIEVVGMVSSECAAAVIGEPRRSSSTVAVIVVVTFFCVALLALLIVFIVVRRRRKLAEKQQSNSSVMVNGFGADKISGTSQHDSGITEDASEEAIIRQHVSSQLAGRLYAADQLSRPDVIRPETPGRDNSCFVADTPELYDIDNASSIAPSDLADVVAHYRMYRQAGVAGPTPQKHPHHRRNHTPDLQPQRATTPRRTSPLVQGGSVRSTPLSGIVGLFPSNESSSSSPAPSFSEVAGPTRGRSQGPAGHAHDKGRGHSGHAPIVNGLSIDEVDRLNRRHTGSPPGVLAEVDGESSDSDTRINRVDFTHADLLRQAPSDSDSDSAASFTCSESPPAVNKPVASTRVTTDDSSVTTLFASDDDHHNWHQLLDWRPDFGRLMGVFNDIAQLPDDAMTRHKSPVSPVVPVVSPKPHSVSPVVAVASPRPHSVSPVVAVASSRPHSVSPVTSNVNRNSPRYANIADQIQPQEEYV